MDFDAFDEETARVIREYGHQVVGVFPTEGDDGAPFAYTVGRTLSGRPELLITGPLRPDIACAILNYAAEVDDGTPLEPGDRDDILVGYTARIVEVDPWASQMFQAVRLFGEEVRALQLVWPDPGGRFPWDEGWAYERDAQPVRVLVRCEVCGESTGDDPRAGHGMCASCLHDALRSGWTP